MTLVPFGEYIGIKESSNTQLPASNGKEKIYTKQRGYIMLSGKDLNLFFCDGHGSYVMDHRYELF